jgi:hypothetical protein
MMAPMTRDELNAQCERGQEELMRTNYLQAERLLADAERQAWAARDFDTLARLYMPLQEARRQIRQRCGEGVVRLDLIARDPGDSLDARQIVKDYPFGQLLVAGHGSIQPGLEVRKLARENDLYLETFLAAADGSSVSIVATAESPIESGMRVPVSELPAGPRAGSAETFAELMSLWERLHLPFLNAADAERDPIRRIELYRKTIDVDSACELAHQKLSDTARLLLRHA